MRRFGEFCADEKITEQERQLLAEVLIASRRWKQTIGGGGKPASWKEMMEAVAACAYRAETAAARNEDTIARRESECLDAVGNLLLMFYLRRDEIKPIIQRHPRK